MLNVYVANLGKYNEGELIGQWLSLPASEEEIQKMYVNIGIAEIINGQFTFGKIEIENGYDYVYEEYAIHDYECDIEGLEIGEWDNVEKLNEKVKMIESKQDYEIEKAATLVEGGYYDDIIIALENIDKHTDVTMEHHSLFNEEFNLGYAMIEQLYGGIENLDRATLEQYFDFEGYAKNIINAGCAFISKEHNIAIID
jgi:antirestriction protein